jgi:hypothetical protein
LFKAGIDGPDCENFGRRRRFHRGPLRVCGIVADKAADKRQCGKSEFHVISLLCHSAARNIHRSGCSLRDVQLLATAPSRLAFLRPLPAMLETDELCCRANMPTHVNPPPETDEQVRALLEKYECPVPFHEVRTRFLGNIATPNVSASPIKVVQGLWGGELPTFDAIDEANELIGALVMGLWTA